MLNEQVGINTSDLSSFMQLQSPAPNMRESCCISPCHPKYTGPIDTNGQNRSHLAISCRELKLTPRYEIVGMRPDPSSQLLSERVPLSLHISTRLFPNYHSQNQLQVKNF